MHIPLRRRFVLFTGLLMLLPASRVRPRFTAAPTAVSDALFAEAVSFIERRYVEHERRVVYNPVSTMQREFGLGFHDGSALVAVLERARVWRVYSTPTGRQAILG